MFHTQRDFGMCGGILAVRTSLWRTIRRQKLYPFGFKIFYKLMLKDANAKGRKFERKVAEGILVGYVVHPGGRWTKDYQCLIWKP